MVTPLTATKDIAMSEAAVLTKLWIADGLGRTIEGDHVKLGEPR